MSYYGVSQYLYGAEHRWIYTDDILSEYVYDNGSVPDEDDIDCGFPYGGSNSSATLIVRLDSDEEIRDFLTAPPEGPDYEDPMLIDLAEYYCRIEIGNMSCTNIFVERFGLHRDEQIDDRYDQAERMIHDLRRAGYEDFDYEDPFYGDNKDMRFYAGLCELHERICRRRREQ